MTNYVHVRDCKVLNHCSKSYIASFMHLKLIVDSFLYSLFCSPTVNKALNLVQFVSPITFVQIQ